MLLLKPEDLKQIADQAEAAYPREACGLLLGFQRVDGNIEVTRVAESENKAAPARNDRFEIDPELRLRLMREARDTAPVGKSGASRGIIGHYHSHPDGTSAPSAYDRETVWPGKSYLIVAVAEAHVVGVRAWRLSDDGHTIVEERVD